MRRIVTVLVLALLATACAGTREAYKAAEGIEDTAKVIGEHYYALVREANQAAGNGQLTGNALLAAQNVVHRTEPIITELANAAEAYKALQNAQTEAELDAAIMKAALAVSNLIDALKRVGVTAELERRTLDTVLAWSPEPAPA